MRNFAHLHVHSDYSLLKSSARIPDLVRQMVELKQTSMALADIDGMYGLVDFIHEFQEVAKEKDLQDMKPILGLQASMQIDDSFASCVLLAKSYEGYKNLMKLSGESFKKGRESQRPFVTKEILKKYSNDLIFLSGGGIDGIGLGFVLKKKDHVKKFFHDLLEILPKEDVYIELTRHGLEREEEAIGEMVEIANLFKIKLVAASEVYYLKEEDRYSNEVLWAIGSGDVMSAEESKRSKLRGKNHHLCSTEEMEILFADFPDALESVSEIVEKSRVLIPAVTPHMPKMDLKENSPIQELRRKCLESLKNRSINLDVYEKRLEYEANVIEKMGFPDYFLIVSDFIMAAKRQGILVGPGRGSAAGSLVAYLLGITNIDPIKEELLFERFLNPERINMPDIDVDFQDNRRDEVIEYCKKKYGYDRVSQIVTFAKLKAKAIFKDVARVFEIPFQEANTLSQYIEGGLKETFEDNITFRGLVQSNPTLRDVYQHALNLEGLSRQTGVHASGVIIADNAIDEYAPICLDKDGNLCTQYEGSKLEEYCGLIKMDFLGLSTLTIIDETLKLIREKYGKIIDIDAIDFADPKVYELFSQGNVTGVFQFESTGMRRYLKQLKPTFFSDIVAMNAMYRPGPMEWIPVYIAKKNRQKLEFNNEENRENFQKLNDLCRKNPDLEKILKVTNLIPIYQEQIMEIGRSYAGFSLGQADIMRRAMGKKNMEVLMKMKDSFVRGAKELGNNEEDSVFLFEKIILPFSGYGFNKSHAASYAYIAYQEAYLKTYYKDCLFCALMNNDIEKPSKLKEMVEEALSMGVQIKPLNVNESEIYFVLKEINVVQYAFAAIKGIASSAGQQIVEERKRGGHYKSFVDFLIRLYDNAKINKQTIEQLIKARAFSSFDHLDEKQMLAVYPKMVERLDQRKQRSLGGQMDLMSMMGESEEENLGDLVRGVLSLEKTSEEDIVLFEEQSLGFSFLSLSKWTELHQYEGLNTISLSSLEGLPHGKNVEAVGFLNDFREITTKNGDLMCMFKLVNTDGSASCVCFPKIYEKLRESVLGMEDKVIFIKSKIKSDARGVSLVINEIDLTTNIKKIEEKIERNESVRSKETSSEVIRKVDYSVYKSLVIEIDDDLLERDSLSRLRDYLDSCYSDEISVSLYFTKARSEIGGRLNIGVDKAALERLRSFPFIVGLKLIQKDPA